MKGHGSQPNGLPGVSVGCIPISEAVRNGSATRSVCFDHLHKNQSKKIKCDMIKCETCTAKAISSYSPLRPPLSAPAAVAVCAASGASAASDIRGVHCERREWQAASGGEWLARRAAGATGQLAGQR